MQQVLLVLILSLAVWAYTPKVSYGGQPNYGNNLITHYGLDNVNGMKAEVSSFEGFQDHDTFEVIDHKRDCPSTYQPLCATNGLFYMHFNNRCHLQKRNDQELLKGHEEYTECSMHLCYPHCKLCPNIVKPICARDMGTYQVQEFKNYCEMNFAICSQKKEYHFIYAGSCLPTSYCPRLCPQIYQPICAHIGKEFRIFQNSCELQRSRCESKIAWSIASLEHCAAEPTYGKYQAFAPAIVVTNVQSPVYQKTFKYNGVKQTMPNYGQVQSLPTVIEKKLSHHAFRLCGTLSAVNSTTVSPVSKINIHIGTYGGGSRQTGNAPTLTSYTSHHTAKPFKLCGTLSAINSTKTTSYPVENVMVKNNKYGGNSGYAGNVVTRKSSSSYKTGLSSYKTGTSSYRTGASSYGGPTIKPFRLCGTLYKLHNGAVHSCGCNGTATYTTTSAS